MADKKKQDAAAAYLERIAGRKTITADQYLEQINQRRNYAQQSAMDKINKLNTALSNDYLSGLGKSGYKSQYEASMAYRAAREASNAYNTAYEYLKNVYGNTSSIDSYDKYIKQLTDSAGNEFDFYRQFKNQQDYNENYAYPMSVKGKTDDEILTMLGAAGTAMGFEDQGAYDAWLNDYYRNHTQTGVGDKIGFNRSKASKLDEMISALEGKTYEPVKTQAWMDAQADVARYSDPTVPQRILDAQAAADATYADQQRLLDVYNRGVSGQQLTADEQALFDSYTGSNDAWGRFVQEIAANDASMQDIMGKMNAMGETTQQNHALINGGYEYYLTGNTRDVQALNAAKAAEQEAQAALDAYDDAHDARIAAMPEVHDTFDTSKLWADIDGADSDGRKALEDALKQAKRAVRQAESAAKTGYNEALLRAKIDVSQAESEAAELAKEYMGLAVTGKSLEKQKHNEARPEAPVKVDEVDAYHDERLKNLASAGEIVMNEQYKAEEEAARLAMADNELLNQYEGERDALDIEHMALVAQQEGVAARSRYNELAQAPDFKRYAAYDSSVTGDGLYDYINNKGTSREIGGEGNVVGMGEFAGAVNLDAPDSAAYYQDQGYSFLLPDEVQAFNYIYAKQGADEARQFLESVGNVLLARRQTALSDKWEKFSEDNGIWASVVARGSNFVSGLAYPAQLLDAVMNPNHSQYSSVYDYNVITGAIDSVQSAEWDEWLSKNGKPIEFMGENLGGRLYGGITSMFDMLLSVGAGKAVGAATGSTAAAKAMTQAVMMSEAGSNTLKGALDRGLPVGQAAALSAASAAIEALTEKYSIEALFADPKGAARFIAKNFATEGSEEFVSNWANAIVDLLINVDRSELAMAAKEQGWQNALMNQLQNAGLDAITGAFTGAIFAGAKVGAGKTAETVNKTAEKIETGKQINKNETYKQLHDLAVAMPEGSKARKLAWKSGEKVSALKAGKVYNALMQELDEKSRESVRNSMVSDIERRLMELGETGDVTAYADAIQKLWMDEKLSAREQNLIASSKAAMQVQRELLDNSEWKKQTEETAYQHRMTAVDKMVDVQRLASEGYVSGENKAASAAISYKASTTYANADREMAYNNTAYTNDGAQVTVQRIEEQDGKPVYIVEQDGQSVAYALNDLELDSYNTELLVQPLKQGKMSAAGVNAALQFYAGSKMRASTYARGFQIAYNAGLKGYGMPYVNANSISGALPQEAQLAAYAAGKAATKKAKPKLTRRSGKVILEDGINYDSLDNRRKAAVDALRPIAEALGIEIRFFASKADKSGSYAKWENGSYKNGVLRLDINAGKDSVDSKAQYAILRTASHELTHHIAEASPELYKELQEFVVTHLVEGGKSMEQLIDDKKARENREITDDEAIEEIVADACEMMLKDSTAIQTLANENATLFEKIANWLKDFFDKIREAFTGVEAVHSEAAALRVQGADGLLHYIDGLQELWDKALVDAGRNMQSAAMNTAESVMDETGEPMYSLRSMQEDYGTYKQWLMDAGVSANEINALFDTIDAVMAAVQENRHILDFGEDIGRDDRSFFPVKPNADPLYKVSLDFSSLCRKRLLQQAVQERLESKYKTVLTKPERVAIRNALIELRKEGMQIEVACALCYVESARLKSPQQIERFMKDKRGMIIDYLSKASKEYGEEIQRAVDKKTVELGYPVKTPMAQMDKNDKKKVQAVKKGMYLKYKPSAAEEAMIHAAETMPEEMYKTADGLWKLKREYPEIFTAYTTFVRNATKSKGIEQDTPFYAGDTAEISDGLIEAMNRENGLRSQSWSDFQVLHMLDYMAAVIELSTRVAKMQSYTKVPEFVKLMGRTGAMINLSLIPNDYDGSLTFDDIEGMNMDVAQRLRDTYHDTVGTISIGISNDHIRALLASSLIDYVIPYHKSSLDKKSRQAMGLKAWDDYEATQGEKQKDYPTTNKNSDKYHKAPMFSEWYNHAEAVEIAKREQKNAPDGDVTYGARMAMIEMADRYIEMCHERGLTEKFPQFAAEENYWKLLIDRKMIDHVTGELIEQRPIKPVFEKQALLDILADEVKRFDEQNADFNKAIAELEKAWERGDIRKAAKSKKVQDEVSAFNDTVLVRNIVESAEGEKFSAREADAAYNQAIDRGDIPAAQKLVDEAARRAGYTVKAYHGTGADFTIFSEGKVSGRNVWGKGFYFGTSKAIADDYATYRAENGGRYRVVDALLKMENPFIPNKSSLGAAEEILDRWFPDMWRGNARDLGIGYIEGKLNRSPLDLLQFIAEHNGVEIRDVLTEYGYDSIKDGGELVVFNANQIKSAEPVTFGDNNRVIPLSERFNEEKDDIRYARRDLLTPAEAKRLESNWNDYKYRGYQFTKRPNGGIMVSMGNLIVYTHTTGDPEYVIEIDDSDTVDYVEESNKIFDRMTQLEKDGVKHEVQRQTLQSMVRSVGAHFRGRKSDHVASIDTEGRRRRGEGQNRAGVGREVSFGRKVSVKKSIFFPSRFNRLYDQYLAKTQSGKYDPANFNPGEFTTMRIGDDVLLLKRRTEKEFGLSAHFVANIGSRLTNERFEGKRFDTRAEAIAWLNKQKSASGKQLLFKSDWEPSRKTMFNMREPVEQTKNMIAMHNISGDAMMQFVKNGRLYWPSVAVVNDRAKFDSFGQYSLLFAPWQFGEDWDDPESAPLTERFRMYGSDAYTPSLPQEVAAALQEGKETFRSMYGELYTDPYSVEDYMETIYGSRYSHGFPGSVRANAAKRYSSIEAMKKDRDRLMRDGAIYDTMTISKDLERLRSDLIYRILKNGGTNVIDYNAYAKFENDLLLNVLDTVEDGKYLEEYGQQLDVIIDYAKGYGIKLNRALAKELLVVFEDVANDDVGYFEIKFSRNVNGATDSGYPQAIVAPDNMPNEIRAFAEEVGIPVYTYKAGDSENRRNVVNDAADTESLKFQARDADTISSREALVNALETAAKNDLERGLLADYKKIIQSLNEDEAKLKEYGQIIKELSFKKGGLTTTEKDELAKAKNRAEIVRERLNRNDKKLLKLEATEALKAVVAREKVVAERKIREKKDAQLAAYRERVKDTASRSAMRDRIKHDVKTLNRLLLNETDTKHIPEELKGAVAQFLTAFTQDSSVFDKGKLDDLRVAYDKISDRAQNSEEISEMAAAYDAGMADLMTDLRTIIDGRRLSELDAEETKMVRDIVQHLLHVVRNTNKLFFEARSEDIAANGQKLIEEADKHGPAKGANAPVVRHIRSLLREGMMTPSYFFKQLGGVGKKLFDALKEGESQYGLRVKDAQGFFDEQAKKYNYDAWRLSDPLKMTTQQGKQIVLTREQALGLYATWKRENSDNGQNAKHLSEGGFVYEEAMKRGKDGIEVDTKNPNKMTEADMQQVANWLTDEQKAFADELVRYMSQDMAKLGNQVSMTLFGVEKFTEKAYYPYQTSQDYRYTPLGQAAATNDQRLKHSSFTRRTQQHANNPIIASDFTTVWANHVNHMILYSSMCVPLENVNRVFNYQYVDENNERHSVKAALKDAYGPQAIEYIKQLMIDINGGVQVKGDNISSKLVSLYKRNAVLGSLSVAIQQPSSVVRAVALVDPKYFTHGAAMGGNWEELTKHSGVAVIKEMGGFDTSTGYGAQDWLLGHRADTKLKAAKNKVEKVSGILPETMDKLGWTAIWRAVKAEIRDTTSLEVGSEEFYQAAAKRFDEVISYTQVYDSVLAKSQMMRNHALDMFTAFMSEPTLTYNMLLDAFTHRGKPDSVSIPRAMAAFVSTAAVNALLKALVTAARDDDEEKSYLEKYLGKSLDSFLSDLNPLNMLPYARDIVTIAQGWSVERPDMSVVSDFFTGIKRGKKAFEDGDIYQGIKEIAAPAGMVLGVPVKNVWRDAEAIVNLAVSIGTGNILPDNAGNVKYSLLDALPFYDGSPTAFYGRRLDAMLAGDEAELESLTIHLETGMGKDSKTIKSQTKTELGKRYKTGKIADTIATDILMDYFGMDADEAYWQLKEWREKEAHKGEEDYSFSRTDDLEEALLGGKTAQIEAAKKELAAGGYTNKDVTSKAKSAIKNLYMDGKITFDKAVQMLNEQTDEYLNKEKGTKKRERQKEIENDLYWLEKEWAYAKANKDNDAAEPWSDYMTLHSTIESGKGQKAAIKELMDNGKTKSGIASSIKAKWRDEYVKLYETDRKAALDLQARILDAYVAAGYNRTEQAAYIKKNWFE